MTSVGFDFTVVRNIVSRRISTENRFFSLKLLFFFVTSHSAKVSTCSKKNLESKILCSCSPLQSWSISRKKEQEEHGQHGQKRNGRSEHIFFSSGGSPGETPPSEANQKVSTTKCTILKQFFSYLSNCLSAVSILITSSSSPSAPSVMTLFQMASAPGKALILKVSMATSPGPALNSSAPVISGGN